MDSIPDGVTQYAKTLNEGESLHCSGAKRISMRENAESKSLLALGRILFNLYPKSIWNPLVH